MKRLRLVLFVTILVVVVFLVYSKQKLLSSITSTFPTPPTAIPSGIMLPTTFTQTSWKKFTSSSLGVSFSYPPGTLLPGEEPSHQSPYANQPTIQEIPSQNSIDVSYEYGYIFRIKRNVTSLPFDKWLLENDFSSNKYHYSIEYKTTFNGLPAVLSIETPETAKNDQVPMNVFYVKSNNAIYEIEYAIPQQPITEYPTNFTTQMKADNDASIKKHSNLFMQYNPQILGSVKFL